MKERSSLRFVGTGQSLMAAVLTGQGEYCLFLLRAHRSTLRRLDFTTGKRRNRGELPKSREANSLGQRTREDKESTWDLTSHTFRVVAK